MRRVRTTLPTDTNRFAPAQIDQSAAAANNRYAMAGSVAVKGSLIQHSTVPDNNTLVETQRQQVADSVKADLFSWDPLEGIESALTRQNIKAFNDIRMKGELFAPMMPIDFINTLGPINQIPSLEGPNEVKKSVMKVVKVAESAADLYITND